MATVTMTGKEYQELLRQQDMGAELIQHIKTSQQIRFTKDKYAVYGVGQFPTQSMYPKWLHDLLVRDMVQQLLNLPAEEFELWAVQNQSYYAPITRSFSAYEAFYNVDLLEKSPALKERWDATKVGKEEETNAGTDFGTPGLL